MTIRNAKDFGLQIREARRRAGITQGVLADRCGTTQSWISELENGKPRAELELALRVLRELGLALQVAESAEPPATQSNSNFDVTDLVGMPRSHKSSSTDDG
ncbi:helix-turn-helix domain-containing protein [Salinisphaera sp. RV14]|uniref:helix-turn-helix domain-containing protein n=1 Tax=unclassified Salinisphaera TaxID=2649847 RepID=UPI003F839030